MDFVHTLGLLQGTNRSSWCRSFWQPLKGLQPLMQLNADLHQGQSSLLPADMFNRTPGLHSLSHPERPWCNLRRRKAVSWTQPGTRVRYLSLPELCNRVQRPNNHVGSRPPRHLDSQSSLLKRHMSFEQMAVLNWKPIDGKLGSSATSPRSHFGTLRPRRPCSRPSAGLCAISVPRPVVAMNAMHFSDCGTPWLCLDSPIAFETSLLIA